VEKYNFPTPAAYIRTCLACIFVQLPIHLPHTGAVCARVGVGGSSRSLLVGAAFPQRPFGTGGGRTLPRGGSRGGRRQKQSGNVLPTGWSIDFYVLHVTKGVFDVEKNNIYTFFLQNNRFLLLRAHIPTSASRVSRP
jgi:hypothetical protein